MTILSSNYFFVWVLNDAKMHLKKFFTLGGVLLTDSWPKLFKMQTSWANIDEILLKNDFIIQRGMRIAQLVITKYEIIQWNLVNKLSIHTTRGTGGFGSTGLK